MSTAAFLPRPPAPPHDPTSLLLNQLTGWKVMSPNGVSVGASLALAKSPTATAILTRKDGSFGGLCPPSNVTLDRFGRIWLLDASSLQLKLFDPCSCSFMVVPGLGGEGAGATQFNSPAGITSAGNDLFLCDAGNQRVSVLDISSFQVRHCLDLAGATPWKPSGVAVDTCGRILVVAEGTLYKFSSRFRPLGEWEGFGQASAITVTCDGEIYLTETDEADNSIFKVGEDGTALPVDPQSDELKGRLNPLPFGMDSQGNMELGKLCQPPTNSAFDLTGNQVAGSVTTSSYVSSGEVVLGPLDSLIDECQWHRVILNGDIPDGSSIEVRAFTAPLEMPDLLVSNGLADASKYAQLAAGTGRGVWDCLIRAPKGRYLWPQLTFRGHGLVTPRLDSIELEFPRISLRRYLPGVYGVEPVSADFTDRFLAIFDRVLRDHESKLDDLAALFDPLSTSGLEWLASWVGVTLDAQLSEAEKRRVLKDSSSYVSRHGTRRALWQQLVTHLGMDRLVEACNCGLEPGKCEPPRETCPASPPPANRWDPPPLILEHFKLRRWLELGSARLGSQSVLWGNSILAASETDRDLPPGTIGVARSSVLGSRQPLGATRLVKPVDAVTDPLRFHANKFTVFVPACAGRRPEQQTAIRNLVGRESPAQAEGFIHFVEARFRIGFQSMIGLDCVVGRYPEGVQLGETPIGRSSVLSGDAEPRVGNSRVGSTSRLI